MLIHKVILSILDHDGLGAEEVKDVLENTKYPNYCIAPQVEEIQSVDIGDWTDDHPMNQSRSGEVFKEMFEGDEKSKFLDAGWEYLHSISGEDVCTDGSCIRCRFAALLEEIESGTPQPSRWSPIETAPKDEDHPILTEEGIARWLSQGEASYWNVQVGFFNCSPGGVIFECADEGIRGSRVDPRWWMDIPPLPQP